MTSLAKSFANLETIGSNGATTMAGGKPYSLVITGLSFYGFHCNVFTDCHQGNSQLVDIAYVLDIQQLAPAGTLVSNNSQLCFDAALSWSHRRDSHLEYRIDQVCRLLHAVDGYVLDAVSFAEQDIFGGFC